MEQPVDAKKHLGSCHCGAIRFEVVTDASAGSRCNCSICTKLGAIGRIVPPSAFTLLSDETALAGYAWGGKTATRYFCPNCGVTCFSRGHLAELGGDYVSVNLNSLDDIDPSEVHLTYWDGRHDNWHAGPRETPFRITPRA